MHYALNHEPEIRMSMLSCMAACGLVRLRCSDGRMQAASYMRGVLRTLAQCHHHRILHRDIKPVGDTVTMEQQNKFVT